MIDSYTVLITVSGSKVLAISAHMVAG